MRGYFPPITLNQYGHCLSLNGAQFVLIFCSVFNLPERRLQASELHLYLGVENLINDYV